MASGTSRRGGRAIKVPFPNGDSVTIYAGVKVLEALRELTDEMPLYHGVRFNQVAKALYEQGVRDGRRQARDAVVSAFESRELRYRNPGRPAKRRAS